MSESRTDPRARDGAATLNDLVDNIAFFVRGGLSPEDAAKRLGQMSSADLVRTALTEYRKRTGRIRSLREPGSIVDDQLVSWYPGPQENDRFWPALEKHLRSKGRNTQTLDDASTKIISLLQPPGSRLIRTRGLVVGYVQSGKTENFTAVISKAADVGYRLFIVLSGINNALRSQTQNRIERDVVQLNPEDWITLTGAYDFRATTNVNAFLTERQTLKILGVLKKHKGRMARLLRWLNSARPEVIQNCPVLVIDDEADQASPNTAQELADRTEINRLLIAILNTLPKAAYVGYTATPFANLLIDPGPADDLYPRDFIVDLPRPDNYFGPERIFGREPLDWEDPDEGADGLDIIRTVPDGELHLLRPPGRDLRESFSPGITESLQEALRYFLLTAAARLTRGQGDYHCSMLVHTSEYTIVHDRFRAPIETELSHLRASLLSAGAPVIAELEDLWSREQAAVPPASVGCTPVMFRALLPNLHSVLERVQIKLEHSRSIDRIEYPEVHEGTPGKIYVVIGGNVLSRGLTIEGLTVSFFVRSASAYDTLLQMGRWFGYRPGYEDLPRLWMTDELKGYFYHLALVEREIRYDIDKYKNGHITPIEFGVRIRTHPVLAITSRLKMQRAVPAKMSFSGREVQTLVFNHQDEGWLRNNIAATRRLLSAILARDIESSTVRGRPSLVFESVPAEDVLAFLTDYQIHDTHVEMRAKLLRDYIESENAKGRLNSWNVVVVTKQNAKRGEIDLGLEKKVALVNRARHNRNIQFADVKALMSGLDLGADVERDDGELKSLKKEQLRRLRDELVPDRGLLLIYPINKDSEPLNTAKDDGSRKPVRLPLGAKDHVIGIALAFPDVEDGTALEYMTVNLSDVERDDPPEVEDLDE